MRGVALLTATEYAASMAGPGLTIEESVAKGLMSAAEGRFIHGHATRDDLIELGYPPEESEIILEEQKAARAPRQLEVVLFSTRRVHAPPAPRKIRH
jgi:hypothetical protein